MAVPIVGGSTKIKVRLVWKNSAQYGMCVCAYRSYLVTGGPVGIDDLVRGLDSQWGAILVGLVPSQAQYWGIGVAFMQSVLPHQATPEFYCKNARAPGSYTGNLLPTQSSGLVSLRTEFPGRPYRGRMYVPFPATDAIDADAALTTAYKSAITALMAASLDVTVPNATATGTASMDRRVENRGFTGLGPSISRYIIRDYMATQRRREEINRADNDPFFGSILVT